MRMKDGNMVDSVKVYVNCGKEDRVGGLFRVGMKVGLKNCRKKVRRWK